MLMTVFLAAKQVIQRQPEIHSLLLLIAEICTLSPSSCSPSMVHTPIPNPSWITDLTIFPELLIKEKKEISFSCLPAEKYLIKDYQHCVLFYSMRTPSVALPNGTDTDSLKKNYTIKKNPAGRPLLTINYSFNGHQVGTARYYPKNSISDLLL